MRVRNCNNSVRHDRKVPPPVPGALTFVFPFVLEKKLKRSGKGKSPTRSLVRLKFLQKYCNELLSCEPRVCQSADLVQFFHPTAQDLQPDFFKNRQVTKHPR